MLLFSDFLHKSSLPILIYLLARHAFALFERTTSTRYFFTYSVTWTILFYMSSKCTILVNPIHRKISSSITLTTVHQCYVDNYYTELWLFFCKTMLKIVYLHFYKLPQLLLTEVAISQKQEVYYLILLYVCLSWITTREA